MSEALEARRFGLSEVNQKFDTFDALVDAVKEQMSKADRMVLRVNWFIGLQAWIIQSESVYGEHSVDEFAKGIGLSTSAVYETKRFYETYSREDLEDRLVAHNVAYRRALALLRCNDGEQRNLIEQASYELSLKDEEVAELVKKANAGKSLPDDMKEMETLVASLGSVDTGIDPALTLGEEGIAEDDDGADEEGGDSDDPDDKPLKNATADPNNEKATLRGIGGACDEVSRAISGLKTKTEALVEQLDTIGGLTGKNYENAEKLLMGTVQEVTDAMKSLYVLNKAIADHNINIRG